MAAVKSVFDRLDDDQKKAVALRRNGAVSAGAGSGKTTVLAARYLDLIFRDRADVASILCLTFTKKAQAEMQARVYRELDSSGDPAARAQVERFSEASISTIDSFCGSILRSSAQDYGYAPDFAVDDPACRELAETEALRFLLGRREEKALAELFSLMGFERAWRGLFAEAAYRFATPFPPTAAAVAAAGGAASTAATPPRPESDFSVPRPESNFAAPRPESDFAAMPARASAAIAESFARAKTKVAKARQSLEAALAEAPSVDAGGKAKAPGKKVAEALAVFASLPPDLEALGLEEAAEALKNLASFDLRYFGKSELDAAAKAAAKAGREAALRVAALAEAAAYAPLEAGILKELDDFATIYRDKKREAGIMSFHDVEVAAIDLLLRRPELRAYWKGRYRYIMVDEFQDDNELQKELLYLLAEAKDRHSAGIPAPADLAPDKLFFVGDDKQSIYRFRGADVAVFNRLGRELGAEGPSLRTNYRSAPELLGFFNILFARVFARGEEGEPADFEARFEEALPRQDPSGPRQDPSGSGGSPLASTFRPSVSLLWKARSIPGGTGEFRNADEALADGIARFIKAGVEEGRFELPARDGKGGETTRKAGYGDFAVLLRSTAKQYILERFLRLHGIGYSAESMRGLFVESPANDIYSALRLALYPGDRVAYAVFLRSPLAALSDDGFVLALSAKLPAFDPETETLLPADDAARLRRGRLILGGIRARADRGPTADLVSWLWLEGGLRLSILRRPDAHPYLEHYDYLFALAVDSDRRREGLSAFLARLEPLMGKPEKLDELDAQREAGSGVRIMSVHKSKGLEFPIVVIPWLENSGQEDGQGEAFYLSEAAGISLNLQPWDEVGAKRRNVFYEEAKELEKRKNAAETKRLFYVACTRAESHLVFAAVEPRNADNRGASFLSLLAGGGGKRAAAEGAADAGVADAAGVAGVTSADGAEAANGPGRTGFEALPSCVEVLDLPDLSAEDYGRLSGADRPREPDSMAGAYQKARVLDRGFPRATVTATSLSAAAWEKALAKQVLEGGPGPAEAESFPTTAADEVGLEGEAFGTVCHAFIEALIKGEEAVLDESLANGLGERARKAVRDEALRLARGFLDSALGREILAFPRVETEKAFHLALGGKMVTGRFDLFAESASEIRIVDFKSNRSRATPEYEGQLALYRAAASGLETGKRVRSWLFWLRAAEAEELEGGGTEDELAALADEVGAAGGPPVDAYGVF